MDLATRPPPFFRRLAGLGIAAAGGFLTWLTWRDARSSGSFSPLGGFGGPAFVVMGLGLVLFKGYRQERLERGEDISDLQGMALLTPRWKVILVLCLGAGAVNFGLLSGWW